MIVKRLEIGEERYRSKVIIIIIIIVSRIKTQTGTFLLSFSFPLFFLNLWYIESLDGYLLLLLVYYRNTTELVQLYQLFVTHHVAQGLIFLSDKLD